MIDLNINLRAFTAAVLSIAFCMVALPAFADNHKQAIVWQELPADIRETLAPMADRWKQLKPQQQHQMVRRAKNKGFKNKADRWKKLSPEQRERIHKARDRFKSMPPEKRKELQKRWDNMSDEERREVKKVKGNLKDLPPEKRQQALKEMRDMTPQQRRNYLKKIKNKHQEGKSKNKN